jgi:ABC-type branched-subunit amino acid transport system substrate-binding protein
MMNRLSVAAVLALSTFGAAGAYAQEHGVSETEIRFAQVAALEGPAASLGLGMRDGLRAAFEEANRAGGVHGRRIVLDSIDDGYEPDRSLAAVEAIIAEDAHLGLVGAVGTPTTAVTQPATTDVGLPMIGPFTGAGFLRDAFNDNVLNVRATYAAETEAWIRHLVDEKGLSRVAILYQDDAFGLVGLDGVNQALARRGLEFVGQAKYQRNTVEVADAVEALGGAAPEAVVMVGAYAPIAAFVKAMRAEGQDPAFVTISFVGSKALAAELGEAREGVVISQVVPFPWDASLPIVAEYQAAMEASQPGAEPGFVTLEGYLAGRVALRALEAAGPDVDRWSYLSAMNALGQFELGGLSFSYGDGDNQGLDDVFLTRIEADGSFSRVGGQDAGS